MPIPFGKLPLQRYNKSCLHGVWISGYGKGGGQHHAKDFARKVHRSPRLDAKDPISGLSSSLRLTFGHLLSKLPGFARQGKPSLLLTSSDASENVQPDSAAL